MAYKIGGHKPKVLVGDGVNYNVRLLFATAIMAGAVLVFGPHVPAWLLAIVVCIMTFFGFCCGYYDGLGLNP